MQTKKRLSELSLIQRLIEEPQRFQFVQAMRILLRWMRRHGIPYEQAIADVLRFQANLSLKFPASELAALPLLPNANHADAELVRMLHSRTGVQVMLTPTFFGLLGVNGTLPLHKTESVAAARRWSGDAAPHAFINFLSQRMTTLFFQAWGKYRLEQTLEVQGNDAQLPLLLALAGQSTARADPQRIRDHVAAYYAALLRTRPVTASTIARVLTHHFGVPIALEPFADIWDVIPDQQRSKLGSDVTRLGYGAALGGRLLRKDRSVRLNIGPLRLPEVEQFLPHRAGALALANMLRLFDLPNLKIQVRLLLDPSCFQRLTLSSKAGVGRRLGWDAVLFGPSGKVSRTSIDYQLPDSVDEIA